MTTRHLDPVLLALSDVLVLIALERAASRVLPRSVRAGERHRAHEHAPIHPDRLDKALDGAWRLCASLAHTHSLDVHVQGWCQLLDSYTRALLTMGRQHHTTALAGHLYAVAVPYDRERAYVAVGA